jgi:hypothetical protein
VEEGIFPRPAVAGILKAGFVESRHHLDVKNTLTDAQLQANRKLALELAGSLATPQYVIVDPNTGKKLRATALSGTFPTWEELMLGFLRGDAK